MLVEFTAEKGRRNFTVTHNMKTTPFRMGKFRTANKEKIKEVMGYPEYRNGYIKLKTAPELVNQWLSGEIPDKLTEKELLHVDVEGLRKIASYLQLQDHGGYPEMIRVMAKGAYVDNMIHQILQEHRKETASEDLVKDAEDAGVIIRNGPWYQFQSPDSSKTENIGRDPGLVVKFVRENKDRVKDAIKFVNAEDEKETEIEA